MKPKKELVRVVRAPVKEDENGVQTGGEVSLDLTGRKPGRAAPSVPFSDTRGPCKRTRRGRACGL